MATTETVVGWRVEYKRLGDPRWFTVDLFGGADEAKARAAANKAYEHSSTDAIRLVQQKEVVVGTRVKPRSFSHG